MLEAYTLSQSYDRLLEEHKALQSQLTEKDETIKELQRQIGAYKSCTPNAWENAQELDRLRKALEEARRYPRQPNNEGGWTLKYDFLEKVSEMTEDGEYCSMEQVEGVLLCAEELLGEGDKE